MKKYQMVKVMINEYKEKLNVIDDVLINMPKTNKKNTNEYKEKALEILRVCNNLKQDLYEEITKRYNNIMLNIPKKDINEEEMNKKLNTLIEYLNLKNDITSPYEKLNIDKNIYELNVNLNDNLTKLNQIIIKLLNTFKKSNIKLTSKDLNLNYYSYNYLKQFFTNENYEVDEEKMREVFTNLYWKCPDIIPNIALNFKYLYRKYEKKFNKYLDKQISKINAKEIKESVDKILIAKSKRLLDEDKIFENFYNEKYDIKDYEESKIESLYKTFIKNDTDYEKYKNDLINLYNTLEEYENLLNYLFLINNVKEIYKEKDKYKQSVKNIVKEINKEEKLLRKYNNKFMTYYNKNETKQDEYNLLINEEITKLQNLYETLEHDRFCNQILININDSSSIYDVLKVSYYNYNFLIKSIEKEGLENQEELIENLKYFLLSPFNTIINNIGFLKNEGIEKVIKEHYKLLNIECDTLDEGNVGTLKKDIEKIIVYNSIKKSTLNIDNIKFIIDVKKNGLERKNIK